MKRRKADWTGYIVLRDCLLKQVTEGEIEGNGRGGRKRKQLLYDLKESMLMELEKGSIRS